MQKPVASASRRTHRIGTVAAALALAAGCSSQPAKNASPEAPQGTVPAAAPDVHVIAALANGTWPMPTGDYGNLRYSPLSTITTANVKDLHPITTLSTGVNHGHEGQPLVIDNT